MNYWLFISLFAAALAVYAMINILMTRMSNRKKMLWFALAVLLPIVGPIIYLLKREAIARVS